MRRSAFLALTLLGAAARADPPDPEVEQWGAYDVRHLPLPGVFWDIAALADRTAVIPSGDQVYLMSPAGRMVGQLSLDGQASPSVTALRGGGFVVGAFKHDPKTDKRIDKLIFAGSDGRKRGEYVTDGISQSVVALRDGGLAIASGFSLIFLGPDGRKLGRLGTEGCWGLPLGEPKITGMFRSFVGVRGIIELPDGRLLVSGGITLRKKASRWTHKGYCVLNRDTKEARLWTPKTRGAPRWILKDGTIVGTSADGLDFMDAKGAVVHRTNARVAGQPPDFNLLTELRDGGVAACSSATGLVLVADARGRERWHFKAGGAVWGAPLELSNGSIVVGSEDHWIYFLGKDGALLGRYRSEESIHSRLLELDDGVVLAALTGARTSSHNLLLFTPTGRPFVPPRSLSGKHCRIAHSSAVPSTLEGRQACPTDTETVPVVRDSFSFIESTCLDYVAGSRPVNLRVLGCRYYDAGAPGKKQTMTAVEVAYDCEACSDAP